MFDPEVGRLHNEAIDWADKAVIARHKGLHREAAFCFRQAAQFEKQAAMKLEKSDVQPTRAVLFRSAAWLALDAGRVYQAATMIALGRERNPPSAILAEIDEAEACLEKVKSYA